MYNSKQDIKVSCNTKNLKKIRGFVNDYLVSIELSDVDRNLIVLAIDEICANKIIHAHGEDEESEISLEIGIQKSPSGIFFNIVDTGVSFEPDNYTEPVLRDLIKEKKKGSLGLVLVQRVMDEVTFRQEKSRNVCRMVKFLQLTDH